MQTNDGGNSWQFVDVPESSSGIPFGFSSSQQHTFSVQTPHFSRLAARNSSSLWLIERHSKRLMILNQKETKVPVPTSSTSDKSESLSFPSTTIPGKSDPTVSQTPVNYTNTFQIAPDSGMLQFVDISTGPDGYGLWTLKLASKIASAGAVPSVSSRAALSPQPPPRSGLSLSNGASRFQFSEVCKLVIQELQTTHISRFVKIWDDRNTGAKENDLAIFRPLPPATIASFISVRRGKTKSLWRKGRWMSLGDFAERSHLDRPLTYNFDSPLNARRFLIRECVMLSEQDYIPPPTPFFVSRPGTGRRNSSRKEMEKSISTEFFVDEDETFGEEVLDVEPEGKEEEGEEKEEELELHDYELDIYSVGGGNGDPYNLMLDIFPPPLLTVPENFQKVFTTSSPCPVDSTRLTTSALFFQVWDDSGTGGITAMSKFGEVSIWKPIPPPGYVALGHVSSPDRVTKPSSVCVGCVHSSAVVPAPFYRYPSG
jgi:hypothetical protein